VISGTRNSTPTRTTTQGGTLTGAGSSTSATSPSGIILPNTSSSLHVVAVITIRPTSLSNDNSSIQALDPNAQPVRDPFNSTTDSDQSRENNGVTSKGVPTGVIVGSVLGVIFGGLALFGLLFGINKLRERRKENKSEMRTRQLRLGTGSSSMMNLVRDPDASGSSRQTGQASINTGEHGEIDREGLLFRDGGDSASGSGRGWIRFANQRRPSSLPVPPENKDNSSTPLMQEWEPPLSTPIPQSYYTEFNYSPTVPSPLRTNPVTGGDSPARYYIDN
jgi:hypothetical protein